MTLDHLKGVRANKGKAGGTRGPLKINFAGGGT
jgi:hypothetical protein